MLDIEEKCACVVKWLSINEVHYKGYVISLQNDALLLEWAVRRRWLPQQWTWLSCSKRGEEDDDGSSSPTRYH